MSVDPPDSGGGAGRRKPKQPFLRRGEGVDRRLNAWKMRGKVVPRPSSAAQHRPSPAKQHQQQGGGSFFRQGGGKGASRCPHAQSAPSIGMAGQNQARVGHQAREMSCGIA